MYNLRPLRSLTNTEKSQEKNQQKQLWFTVTNMMILSIACLLASSYPSGSFLHQKNTIVFNNMPCPFSPTYLSWKGCSSPNSFKCFFCFFVNLLIASFSRRCLFPMLTRLPANPRVTNTSLVFQEISKYCHLLDRSMHDTKIRAPPCARNG